MTRFTVDEAQRARETWGANCGPGALAAVLGLTLDNARHLLRGFNAKRYTNPSMMRAALNGTGWKYEWRVCQRGYLPPINGLARVQWEGPWTEPGVPPRAAYGHTHWIGGRVVDSVSYVFDINAMAVGGWITFSRWQRSLVPWLLGQLEPKATGEWWLDSYR